MGTKQMRGYWKEEDNVDVDNGSKVKRWAGVDCIMEVVREREKKKWFGHIVRLDQGSIRKWRIPVEGNDQEKY